MNAKDEQSRFSLVAFVFAILFVVHVMLIPVWFGLAGMMFFGVAADGFFGAVPVWFVFSGFACLSISVISSLVHPS